MNRAIDVTLDGFASLGNSNPELIELIRNQWGDNKSRIGTMHVIQKNGENVEIRIPLRFPLDFYEGKK